MQYSHAQNVQGGFNYTFCPPKQFLMLVIISCPGGCWLETIQPL